jgi:hypothetical protein
MESSVMKYAQVYYESFNLAQYPERFETDEEINDNWWIILVWEDGLYSFPPGPNEGDHSVIAERTGNARLYPSPYYRLLREHQEVDDAYVQWGKHNPDETWEYPLKVVSWRRPDMWYRYDRNGDNGPVIEGEEIEYPRGEVYSPNGILHTAKGEIVYRSGEAVEYERSYSRGRQRKNKGT